MPKYKVRPEKRHGVGGRYGPGDIVELDESAAAAFSDKLELIEQSESEDQPMPTEELVELHRPLNDAFDSKLTKLLADAGYENVEDVAGATDDELLAILGMGEKMLERTRVAIRR